MVGTLYSPEDKRKDSAYTIFYMGINLGALFAPWICGPLGESFGWWPGFAAAGVGMTLGLVTFVFTQRLLQGSGLPPGRDSAPDAVLNVGDWVQIALISAALAGGVYGAIAVWPRLQPVWSPSFLPENMYAVAAYKGAVLIAILGFFLYLTEPKRARPVPGVAEEPDALADDVGAAKASAPKDAPLTAEEWQRIVVILIISLFSIVFWMGFEQSGGTLNLFADQQVDRNVLGWEMPASVLQSVNPLFIILLAPVFTRLWNGLDRWSVPLPSFAKQGLGLILLGVGFSVMYFADEAEKPTAAFSEKFEAVLNTVPPSEETSAQPEKDEKGEVIPDTGPLMRHAEEEFARGRIPYRDLFDTIDALEKRHASEATIAPVQAAYDEAVKSRVSVWWLIGTYFTFTVAELFLSPIGLSLVNRLAPWKLASLMMACWFLCTAAANYLAGIIDPILEHYPNLNLWVYLGSMAAISGVLMIAVTPLLVRMSHGKA
jgi:dipeptide/tripeptide permease